MPFGIGAFDIDPARNRIYLDQQDFAVEPLVMDVLLYLGRNAGRVISREELIDQVWMPGRGSDESLTRAIALLRRVFAHDPSGETYIETVWKRGYALNAAVTFGELPATSLGEEAMSDYSVAVLPFLNASERPSDAFLSDGITRDLTMLLSRVPRLRVAAYSSAILHHEGSMPLPDLCTALGVRYAVSGSLSRKGDSFQLRVALMDGVDDTQLWAKRIDAPLAEFFEVQDEIVLDVSMSLASALQVSHVATLTGRRPFQLTAYELVQRAEMLRLKYNRETAFEIVHLLDRALEIDPEDATVHAALAVQHTQNVVSSFVPRPQSVFAKAITHVDRALALAPTDPEALAAAGIAATMMGDAVTAVKHLQSAVAVDPNNPHTLAVLGWQKCWTEGTRAGIDMIRLAEQRAPHHPRYSVWAHYRGHCEIRLGNVRQAISAYRDGAERNPDYTLNLATFAAALELDGQVQEAGEICARLSALDPDYSPQKLADLAGRMTSWFGESPSRGEFTGAFEAAWSRVSQTA